MNIAPTKKIEVFWCQNVQEVAYVGYKNMPSIYFGDYWWKNWPDVLTITCPIGVNRLMIC